jgi:hypothetical protein
MVWVGVISIGLERIGGDEPCLSQHMRYKTGMETKGPGGEEPGLD